MLFIPIREAFIIVKFAKLFFKYIEYHFETPRDIIFNKDSYIILKFWYEIYKIQMIKKYISIIYYL